MTSSIPQKSHCVLPSIQDLLSDRDFDKLRLDSPEPVPNVPTTSIMASQCMALDSKSLSRHGTPPIPCPHYPKSPSQDAARGAPYPGVRLSTSPRLPESAGKAFENHLPLRSRFPNTHTAVPPVPGRLSAAQQNLAILDLPSYVLTPDQCPPDDDRRHGCGICHRRFNRPSSLMIHMNSHTGAQPFKCPFPGCTRRFSVNSNMRRHYRNHREGAPLTAHVHPYPASFYSTPDTLHPYYGASSASSSAPSSPSNTDDNQFYAADTASCSQSSSSPAWALSAGLPRAEDRPLARPRACTMPGCNCDMEPPSALRPAFRGEPYTRPSPKHR